MFYYLLAGASEEERKAFHLKKPEEYHYLSQVGTAEHDPFGLLCVVVCCDAWTTFCLPVWVTMCERPVRCVGACMVCVCVRVRPGNRGKTRTREETHSTGFGFQHLFQSVSLQTRSPGSVQTHTCSCLCHTRVHELPHHCTIQ